MIYPRYSDSKVQSTQPKSSHVLHVPHLLTIFNSSLPLSSGCLWREPGAKIGPG